MWKNEINNFVGNPRLSAARLRRFELGSAESRPDTFFFHFFNYIIKNVVHKYIGKCALFESNKFNKILLLILIFNIKNFL